MRAEAEARGLTVAQKPDSHDICFIPDGDTRGWLAEKVGTATGEIVDRAGEVVGSHEGAHAFTVGQRRGLKLGVPAADGKPRFVLEVRPVSNTIVVGPKEALAIAEIAGKRFSWAGAGPKATSFDCHVQIRAHSEPVAARAVVSDDGVRVVPEIPLDGVAPGQTAVLYVGTRVLGQFTIDTTVSAVPVGA